MFCGEMNVYSDVIMLKLVSVLLLATFGLAQLVPDLTSYGKPGDCKKVCFYYVQCFFL